MRTIICIAGFLACVPIAGAQTQSVTPDSDPANTEEWYSVFTLPNSVSALGNNILLKDALAVEESHQTFKLYSNENWVVNLDIISRPEQETNSKTDPREQASAKAHFKMSPSWIVGGSVSVGMQELDNSSEWDGQRLQAGIRLESAFRF